MEFRQHWLMDTTFQLHRKKSWQLQLITSCMLYMCKSPRRIYFQCSFYKKVIKSYKYIYENIMLHVINTQSYQFKGIIIVNILQKP